MLWIPGPTEVRPEVLREFEKPQIGHRGKAMTDLIEALDPGLKLAFGLEAGSRSTVAVGNHSATGMMEGSLHGVGSRVLAVVNGAFSKRWSEIARILGKDVTVVEISLGGAVSGEQLGLALERNGPFDAVTLVVNETSTGVQTPLGPVADALARSPDTLLLVDVVSAIAGVAIDFDRNRIDLALAGINKALALPPGITVMCVSERYLERAKKQVRRAWYLDPVRTVEGHVARKTPATPCIPLYRALARQLADITQGVTLPARDQGKTGAAAWTARFEKHARLRRRTLAWALDRGFAPFPAEALSSATVSCLKAGALEVEPFLAALKKRGHEVGNGYDTLKNKTFRIGHMGDHTEEGLEGLIACMDAVLEGR